MALLLCSASLLCFMALLLCSASLLCFMALLLCSASLLCFMALLHLSKNFSLPDEIDVQVTKLSQSAQLSNPNIGFDIKSYMKFSYIPFIYRGKRNKDG